MIADFGDEGTEDIYNLRTSKEARKTLPMELHGIAKRKLNMIALAITLKDLLAPPNNRLERLFGDLVGFYSIRINERWRIIFIWDEGQAHQVKICDYH